MLTEQELIDLIKIEISWYSEHPIYPKNFQEGFNAGLEKVITMIKNLEKDKCPFCDEKIETIRKKMSNNK